MTRAKLARLRKLEEKARQVTAALEEAQARAYVAGLTPDEIRTAYALLLEAREDPAEAARLEALSTEDLMSEIDSLLGRQS
ncbi:MAG: hypothetical protein Q4C89_01420 [Deinococcus sp.]|uniref:hypothetical protein n=1 Tax=Deinococcus sp. TaxID=47478 RepID=UPI0026DB880D|nr:hypothetical protein [Deinococcus sp.]MDO4244668.1 hypothetical protein [Deinococcus sp.]